MQCLVKGRHRVQRDAHVRRRDTEHHQQQHRRHHGQRSQYPGEEHLDHADGEDTEEGDAHDRQRVLRSDNTHDRSGDQPHQGRDQSRPADEDRDRPALAQQQLRSIRQRDTQRQVASHHQCGGEEHRAHTGRVIVGQGHEILVLDLRAGRCDHRRHQLLDSGRLGRSGGTRGVEGRTVVLEDDGTDDLPVDDGLTGVLGVVDDAGIHRPVVDVVQRIGDLFGALACHSHRQVLRRRGMHGEEVSPDHHPHHHQREDEHRDVAADLLGARPLGGLQFLVGGLFCSVSRGISRVSRVSRVSRGALLCFRSGHTPAVVDETRQSYAT